MGQPKGRGTAVVGGSKLTRGRSDVESYSGRGASPALTMAVGQRATRSQGKDEVNPENDSAEAEVGSRSRESDPDQDKDDINAVQEMLDDSHVLPVEAAPVARKGKGVQGAKIVRWASNPAPLVDDGAKDDEVTEDEDDEFTLAQPNEIEDNDSLEEELYPEEVSLEVIKVSKKTVPKTKALHVQPKGKSAGGPKAGGKSGAASLKFSGIISLGVHSRDRLLRTIRIQPSESYDHLVFEVRKHINDLTSDLELAYSLAWMPKNDRHALESQDDWEALIRVIASNKRKLPDQHHALLYHFLDNEVAAQGGSKGKGKKKGVTGQSQDVTSMKPDSLEVLTIILAKHECTAHPHQCYIEVGEGGKEAHYNISNEEMTYWSKCCTNGKGWSPNTVPDELIPKIKSRGSLAMPTPSAQTSATRSKFVAVGPKACGTTGNVPAQPTEATTPADAVPQAPQFPPYMGQWPGMFPPAGAGHLYFMMPQMMSSPRAFAGAYGYPYQAPPSPTRPTRTFDEGEELDDWLPQFDAGAGPEDERYGDLLEPFKAIGLRRVRDVTLFTPQEIMEYTNCSVAMAKRVLDRANAAMRSRR